MTWASQIRSVLVLRSALSCSPDHNDQFGKTRFSFFYAVLIVSILDAYIFAQKRIDYEDAAFNSPKTGKLNGVANLLGPRKRTPISESKPLLDYQLRLSLAPIRESVKVVWYCKLVQVIWLFHIPLDLGGSHGAPKSTPPPQVTWWAYGGPQANKFVRFPSKLSLCSPKVPDSTFLSRFD